MGTEFSATEYVITADELDEEAAETEPVMWDITSISTRSSDSDHLIGSKEKKQHFKLSKIYSITRSISTSTLFVDEFQHNIVNVNPF